MLVWHRCSRIHRAIQPLVAKLHQHLALDLLSPNDRFFQFDIADQILVKLFDYYQSTPESFVGGCLPLLFHLSAF